MEMTAFPDFSKKFTQSTTDMKFIRLFAIALLISSPMLFAAGWEFPRKDSKLGMLNDIPNWGQEGVTAEVWCRTDVASCGYAVLMQGAFGLPKFEGDDGYVAYLKLADGAALVRERMGW